MTVEQKEAGLGPDGENLTCPQLLTLIFMLYEQEIHFYVIESSMLVCCVFCFLHFCFFPP